VAGRASAPRIAAEPTEGAGSLRSEVLPSFEGKLSHPPWEGGRIDVRRRGGAVRKLVLGAVISLVVGMAALPSSAITYGHVDGERHSGVGSLLGKSRKGRFF
jgi:hypothetical protein